MRALRWTGASLLMLLAGLLGLVGGLLCITLILLPLGIPLLFLARKLFRAAGALVVPRQVRHPVKEGRRKASDLKSGGSDAASSGLQKVKELAPGQRSRTARLRRRLHLG